MALYHKYRPQTFADTVGQEHVKQTLMNQIRMDKVAHAYLFFGPRGVGKTTLARLLAKAVNCPKAEGSDVEPDNTSQAAIDISNSRSLDVIEIDAASHTGVDHVREHIIEHAQFKPSSLPYKVFIIDEVHMLSTSAFNALLKTLEEPPKHVIFILATTELHKLPETIVSRCQRFTFQKIDYKTLKSHIAYIAKEEGVSLEDSVIDRIINKSDGCARDAISLLDQLIATGEKKITAEVASIVLPTSFVEETFSFCESLVTKQAVQALAVLASCNAKGIRMKQFAHDCLELLRAMLIVSVSGSIEQVSIDITDEMKQNLVSLSNSLSPASLVQLIDIVMKRFQEISRAPISELPLEMAVVEWCGIDHMHETNDSNQQSVPTPKQKDTTPTPTSASSTPVVYSVEPELPKKVEPVLVDTSQRVEVEPVVDSSSEESVEKIPDAVKPVEEVSTGEAVCSLDDVKKYWHACVSAIEKESPSLSFILKMTEVQALAGNVLTLSVQYSFHQDKLLAVQTKQRLETALQEAAQGIMFSLAVVIDEQAEKPSFDSKPVNVQDLASAFGGQVVG